MKTVKTANGLRTIGGEDRNVISTQLSSIIQDHRTTLIENLISGDLNRYIDYKFNKTLELPLLNKIKNNLIALKEGGVSMLKYRSILDSLIRFDFIQLSNDLFFHEIDEHITGILSQSELFQRQRMA